MNEINLRIGLCRLAAFAALATLFAYAVVLTVPQASVNELAMQFGASDAALGFLFRLFMIGFFIAALVGGGLSDRFGKLPVMTAGCALMAAGMFVFAQASVFGALPYAALVGGIGGGLAEVVSMALISDLYEGQKRTAMMNWAQFAFSAGAFIQPLFFARLLVMGMGWRPGYLAAAALSVVGMLISGIASVAAPSVERGGQEEQSNWRAVVRDKTLVRLALGLLLYVGAELGLGNWIAVYMSRDIHANAATAARSVALLWVGIGVGRIVATRLSRVVSDDTLIRWSIALGTVGMAGLLLSREASVALVMTFVVGLPFGPVWPTIVSRTSNAFPNQSGTAIGIVAAAGCLGGAIIPPLIGRVSDTTGMRAALWISVGALVVCLATMMAGGSEGRGEA